MKSLFFRPFGRLVLISFKGTKGISELLNFCKDQHIHEVIRAKKTTKRLQDAGLIEKVAQESISGWRPTAKGLEQGIVEVPPSVGREFYMCKYPRAAAHAILPFITLADRNTF